ncbi:heat shock protein 78, mitochondrial-like [Salvia miltiorrhiza]|uniref:heat shock protein 78, mitochondrial-like n=1 Tax=Salvia miltiorrhiza TaxID=226208 RepID=UPI0025AD84FA|nr:heat shock protein 78, mitochondrial-like [Salvia miltiorrhiza]
MVRVSPEIGVLIGFWIFYFHKMEIFKRLFGSLLQNYATDLTLMAERGELQAVIGREKEMEQLIDALLKRRKSNPCLVGDAGVGKTAIVEGLAIKIAQGSVPDKLKGKRVLINLKFGS